MYGCQALFLQYQDTASNQSSNEEDGDDWLSYPSGRNSVLDADYASQKDNDLSASSYGVPPSAPPMTLSKANIDITTLGGAPIKTPAPVRRMG
jgi:hypothetical protein